MYYDPFKNRFVYTESESVVGIAKQLGKLFFAALGFLILWKACI